MQADLELIVQTVRNYPGVLRKQPIRDVVKKLNATRKYGTSLPNYGDDAAVIPWGEGFLLLAADGIMQSLLINEPYAAGKAAVMVTVNDIYSMGGRPLGLVNVLASGDSKQRAEIVQGIAKGCRKLKTPMLGGHLHPDADTRNPSLSVAILGCAEKVLHGHLAQTGDDLILALDLNGRPGCRSVVSWDANSGKTSEELLFRLETLPLIANQNLAHACKDISNAGILGTTSIMMENSRQGAMIDLAAIPKPDALKLKDWLICFQSFGFILAASSEKSQEVCRLFEKRHITARIIGQVTDKPTIIIQQASESRVLFDFEKHIITGLSSA